MREVKNPGNFIVKIGTNTKDLIDYCGGVTGDDVTIKAGGPMMGFLLTDTNVPIMKGSNGIIAVDTDHTVEQPCIKCGRVYGCVSYGTVSTVFRKICG